MHRGKRDVDTKMEDISSKGIMQQFGRWSGTVRRNAGLVHDDTLIESRPESGAVLSHIIGHTFSETHITGNPSLQPNLSVSLSSYMDGPNVEQSVLRSRTVFRHPPSGEANEPFSINALPSPKQLFRKRKLRKPNGSPTIQGDIMAHINELQKKRAKIESRGNTEAPCKEMISNMNLENDLQMQPTPYVPLSDKIFIPNKINWGVDTECEDPMPLAPRSLKEAPITNDVHTQFKPHLFQISEE